MMVGSGDGFGARIFRFCGPMVAWVPAAAGKLEGVERAQTPN